MRTTLYLLTSFVERVDIRAVEVNRVTHYGCREDPVCDMACLCLCLCYAQSSTVDSDDCKLGNFWLQLLKL